MLPAPLQRLLTTPSRKFAVLVVLGMSMVALPLADAWRRLGLELQATSAAQNGLAPLALNLQTQQALAAHRPFAAAVLSGRIEQESERTRRQSHVDKQLALLGEVLETQRLYRALDEADQLRDGWSALLQGIGQRHLQPAASDHSHQLMIEQTYIIADLVAAATGLHGQAGRAFSRAECELAWVALPRYAAALAAMAAPVAEAQDAAGRPGSGALARAAARLAARAAAAVLAEAGVASTATASAAARPLELKLEVEVAGRALSPEMLAALMSLQQSAQAIAQATAMDAAAVRTAEQQALHAASVLVPHLQGRLQLAQDALRLERALAAITGAIALLVAVLAAALALPRAGSEADGEAQAQAWSQSQPWSKSLSPSQGDAVDAADTLPQHTAPLLRPTQGAESELATTELMQRLRRSEPEGHGEVDIDLGATDTAQPDPPAGR